MITTAAVVKAFAVVGAGVVGGTAVKAFSELAKERDSRFRRNFMLALHRAKLEVIDQAHLKAKPYRYLCRIKSISKDDRGHRVVNLRLPVGITLLDFYKTRPVLESALKAEVHFSLEGRDMAVSVFDGRLPEKVLYQDMPQDEQIKIALSRRGWECQEFVDPTLSHILIGGQTNMGKSNLIDVIVAQLLPRNVELFMIDTKKVELNHYKGVSKVKYVAQEIDEALLVTERVCAIMEERAEILAKHGFNKVADYNEVAANPLPNVYLIVDEFADFGKIKPFWNMISAVARKGRFAGVYLIMSTQRPSADVLEQQVKANMGLRIALRVTTLGNSKILLENERAFTLPNKQGRCVVETTEGQMEAQIPLLTKDKLGEILSQYKRSGQHDRNHVRERSDSDSGGGGREQGHRGNHVQDGEGEAGGAGGDYRLD